MRKPYILVAALALSALLIVSLWLGADKSFGANEQDLNVSGATTAPRRSKFAPALASNCINGSAAPAAICNSLE
jgi:hypothetical protein